MAQHTDENTRAVLRVVNAIPLGRVATYGQVAQLAGLPGHARQVGYILKRLPQDSRIPWHRVVNARGQISLTHKAKERQQKLLLSEQVACDTARINLARFQWQPH